MIQQPADAASSDSKYNEKIKAPLIISKSFKIFYDALSSYLDVI